MGNYKGLPTTNDDGEAIYNFGLTEADFTLLIDLCDYKDVDECAARTLRNSLVAKRTKLRVRVREQNRSREVHPTQHRPRLALVLTDGRAATQEVLQV